MKEKVSSEYFLFFQQSGGLPFIKKTVVLDDVSKDLATFVRDMAGNGDAPVAFLECRGVNDCSYGHEPPTGTILAHVLWPLTGRNEIQSEYYNQIKNKILEDWTIYSGQANYEFYLGYRSSGDAEPGGRGTHALPNRAGRSHRYTHRPPP